MYKRLLILAICCFCLISAIDRKLLDTCFPLIEHEVTTPDGYIISIFQLDVRGSGVKNYKNESVALDPGTGGNCNVFTALRNKSLACKLASEGFDVWLLNNRGNDFARKHVSLSPEEKEFWDFSFHEMGAVDLPFIVDYILAQSGQEQLHFMSHSAGGAHLLVLLSQKPEYNSKFKSAQLMAPTVLGAKNPNAKIRFEIDLNLDIYKAGMIDKMGFFEFNHTDAKTQAAKGKDTTGYYVFENMDELNPYINSGGAYKEGVHFLQQGVVSDGFSQFDYGCLKNLRKYGTCEPPDYDLSLATLPITIYHGGKDIQVGEKVVKKLASMLPHPITVKIEDFHHMDFLLNSEAYDKVYKLMAEHLLKK